MFYARDFRIGDIVVVVNDIQLPDGSQIAINTKAEVIVVEPHRVDLQIKCIDQPPEGSQPTSLLTGETFSLFDALGPHTNRPLLVTHLEITFRKNGDSGGDYVIEGPVYPPVPLEHFKTVSGKPHIWDSADCGVDALAAYGRRIANKPPPDKT